MRKKCWWKYFYAKSLLDGNKTKSIFNFWLISSSFSRAIVWLGRRYNLFFAVKENLTLIETNNIVILFEELRQEKFFLSMSYKTTWLAKNLFLWCFSVFVHIERMPFFSYNRRYKLGVIHSYMPVFFVYYCVIVKNLYNSWFCLVKNFFTNMKKKFLFINFLCQVNNYHS